MCGGCVDVEVDGLILIDVGVVFAEAGAEVVGLLQNRGLDVGVSELVLDFLEHFFDSGSLGGFFGVGGGEGFSIVGLAGDCVCCGVVGRDGFFSNAGVFSWSLVFGVAFWFAGAAVCCFAGVHFGACFVGYCLVVVIKPIDPVLVVV